IVALFDQSSEIRIREQILVEAEHRLANDTIDESFAIRRELQKFTDLVDEFSRRDGAEEDGFTARAAEIVAALRKHVADFLEHANVAAERRLRGPLGTPVKQKISATIATALEKFDRAITERQLMFNWVNRIPEGREIDFPAQLH